MKAVVNTKYGSPDVLQIVEVEKPVPADNEVLIKINAMTVETTDTIFRGGKVLSARMATGIMKPKDTIPGSEFAGEIEAVGQAVTRFRVGDRVFGTAAPKVGAHAEYISLPENSAMALIPDHLSDVEAVAIHPGAMTALPNIQGAANIQPRQKILIIGASGGIGSSAVQLAKHFGADVTGVCSTANVDLVKSLGADHVIDYKKEDFTQSAERYNVVFDTVGKSSFSQAKRVLKPDGIYLTTILSPPSCARCCGLHVSDAKRRSSCLPDCDPLRKSKAIWICCLSSSKRESLDPSLTAPIRWSKSLRLTDTLKPDGKREMWSSRLIDSAEMSVPVW